ncbi:collagen alpha-1(I) chain-like [Lontra canadensis]|uniref:collagen alpha-1(I) chain-like n=1 Tax=Lontra canadensis TaxID=76717 RepID=UPI0013F3365C|nr:collagen alpha-1(I) chain-like [Lontra canadensis]
MAFMRYAEGEQSGVDALSCGSPKKGKVGSLEKGRTSLTLVLLTPRIWLPRPQPGMKTRQLLAPRLSDAGGRPFSLLTPCVCRRDPYLAQTKPLAMRHHHPRVRSSWLVAPQPAAAQPLPPGLVLAKSAKVGAPVWKSSAGALREGVEQAGGLERDSTAIPENGEPNFPSAAAAGQLGGSREPPLLRSSLRFLGAKTGAWGWRYAGAVGAPGLATPPATQSEERRNSELEDCPALATAARGGPPLPATRVGCGEGSGPALRPAWKGGSRATRRRRASGRRTRSPLGDWGGLRPPPERGGEGEGRGPGAPRPPGAGGRAAGAPVGRGRALSAAARLWEGASPGTRWRGKGGIAGARHAERPRSAGAAAGGGAGRRRPRAPPAPAPAAGPHPSRRPRAPRSPPRACGGGRLRLPPQSPGRGSCRKWLPKRRQSPRCHGRGAGAAAPSGPAPLPSPGDSPPGRWDPGGQRVMGGAGGWGGRGRSGRSGGRAGRGRGGYLRAEGRGVGGRWQEAGAGTEGALALPPLCKPRALPGSRLPGGEMLMGLLTSVTAGRPRPSRDSPASPPPPRGGAAGRARLDAPRRKMKIKLKAVRVPTTKRPKPGTPRRRSGWILGRHELQRRRELGRCRAPTLLSAGSRSPTPASAPPRAAPAAGAPAAALRLPGTRAQALFFGRQGEPGASWSPRRELGTGPRGALEQGKKLPPESPAWGSWGINEKCEPRARSGFPVGGIAGRLRKAAALERRARSQAKSPGR